MSAVSRQITVGVGAGHRDTVDVAVDLGPQHPSGHGALRLNLSLDGDRIAAAEPVVGYLHRGAEKLFEVRDYRQLSMLANRHDWLSAFSSELGVVLALERMLGMQVPERATWLRTLLAELNRVLSHLAFLGSFPVEFGAPLATRAFAAREVIQAVMEEAAGGRMHFMFNRVGGLKEEVPAGWTDRVRSAVAVARRDLPGLEGIVRDDESFAFRTRGVGILSPQAVREYGVSGPPARASTLDFDLRRDEPYLAYGELQDVLRVVTRAEGDCQARFLCLLEQIPVSLDLADACLDALARCTGPVNVRLPKTLKAPEGHTYCWTENPLGVNGYFLVSRGERTPWRCKLRSASFNNVQVLREILPGTRVADLVAVLGSLFFIVGDIDK